MRKGAIGSRARVLVGATALTLGGLLASPAIAAQQSPPGWIDPGGNAWVAFTLSDYSPSPSGRTSYAPVDLERTSSGAVDVAWFDNWEALDTDTTPGADTWRWPLIWEPGGGIRLERLDACDYTEARCRYSIVSGSGQPFWVFGGTPLTDINGNPDPDPASFSEGPISLSALPTIRIGTIGATGIAGTGGAAGTIHLDAPGTVDDANLGPLTYKWVLKGPRGKIYTSEGTDDFFDVTAEVDGVYCVELTVTAPDGFSSATPTCDAGAATFSISGVAPTEKSEPAPTPGGGTGGGGGGGAGGGGTGGGGGIPGIGFSNPARRAPSTLTGGGIGASPTVVWLWRPEWFQPTPQKTTVPRTDGQPQVRGHEDIVVRVPAPKGASAGPWLAGVGMFGLLGGGWMVSRRRRMRMLAEL